MSSKTLYSRTKLTIYPNDWKIIVAAISIQSFQIGSDRTILDEDKDAWSAPSLLELGGTYLDLIDLPTISPYLTKLLGEHYRLDHDYAKIDSKMPEREKTLYLHGGGQGAGGPADLVGPSDGGQCFYRYSNGRFFNGLVAVAFELDDVQASDGGFACVPGSHKSNIGLPAAWRHSKTQADVPDFVQTSRCGRWRCNYFHRSLCPWHGALGGQTRKRAKNPILQVLSSRRGLESVLLQRQQLSRFKRRATEVANAA